MQPPAKPPPLVPPPPTSFRCHEHPVSPHSCFNKPPMLIMKEISGLNAHSSLPSTFSQASTCPTTNATVLPPASQKELTHQENNQDGSTTNKLHFGNANAALQ
eukprot:3554302-Ditylum_brightwellii.AAC.1